MSTKEMRGFVRRWVRAGAALEEQRCRDLQALDDDTARRMTDDLFRLWVPSETRNQTSGLVEQQQIFRKLRLSTHEDDAD